MLALIESIIVLQNSSSPILRSECLDKISGNYVENLVVINVNEEG